MNRYFIVRLPDGTLLVVVSPRESEAKKQIEDMFGGQFYFTIDDIPAGRTLIIDVDVTGSQLGKLFGLKKL